MVIIFVPKKKLIKLLTFWKGNSFLFTWQSRPSSLHKWWPSIASDQWDVGIGWWIGYNHDHLVERELCAKEWNDITSLWRNKEFMRDFFPFCTVIEFEIHHCHLRSLIWTFSNRKGWKMRGSCRNYQDSTTQETEVDNLLARNLFLYHHSFLGGRHLPS